MTDHNRRIDVYQHLCNRAAFIDKAVIDIWGLRRKRSLRRIVRERNLAIGGPGRFYGRAIRGQSAVSGNQLQFRYGVLRRFRSLSPFKMTFWAGRRVLLCADVLLILDSLMRQGYRARVSTAELTFDVDNDLLGLFTEELCAGTRLLREFSGSKSKTLYVGAVNSSWNAKFYKRTDSVARIEFTFRSEFLRKNNIARLHELYLLRQVDLSRLISFRLVDQSHGRTLPPRIKVPWTILGHGLPPSVPASIILRELREARVSPSKFVVSSPRESLLRKMQRNLIW